MKIDTNTPVAALCEQLREWSGCNGKEASELLEEVADRLELLKGENEDLRLYLHSARIQSEVRWKRLQLEAERIKKLEAENDALMADLLLWTGAEEAKP